MEVLEPAVPIGRKFNAINRLRPEDRAFHDWYRFVLSFPPHLVSDYISRWRLDSSSRVFDPFCGTGTTVVEAQKQGLHGVGLEANPMAQLAGRVKTNWTPDSHLLWEHSNYIAEKASAHLKRDGISDVPALYDAEKRLQRGGLKELEPAAASLILTDSISPLPLHKALVLRLYIDKFADPEFIEHQKLALAKALVSSIGNIRFGPEVGITKPKLDAAVLATWLANIRTMCDDLREYQSSEITRSQILSADARVCGEHLAPNSIDAVITSPPYPNEKDYTRTTRLESVILGLISTKADLRQLKSGLLRSNTRNVYRADTDDSWATNFPDIQRIASRIEERRLELGKTSGFEKLYARVTLLYFGGMARHLSSLRPALRPGSRLVYVVGDQASYLRVMIRTGQLLAQIAESLGYEVCDLELFRTRIATATGEQLREEALILRWKG